MKKRLISIALVLVMVLGLLPFSALAETMITDVTITGVTTPKAGQNPVTEGLSTTTPTRCTVATTGYQAPAWYEVGSYTKLTDYDTFEPNKDYRLDIYLNAKSGYMFNTAKPTSDAVNITAYGSYKSTNTWVTYGGGSQVYPGVRVVSIYYHCETYLGNTFEHPELYDFPGATVPSPVEGGSPNFTVTPDHPSLYTASNVKWYPTSNPSSALTSSSKFQPHIAYSCEYTLTTKDRVYFDTRDFAMIDDTTILSVNSSTARCRCDFYPLDEAITSANLTGIQMPVAGQKPQTSGISGGNYMTMGSINVEGNFNTDGTYKSGETYTLTVNFVSKDGYWFDYTKIGKDKVTANYGTVTSATVGEFYDLIVKIRFTVSGQKEKIDLGDLTYDMSSGVYQYTSSDITHPAAYLLTMLWLSDYGEKQFMSKKYGDDSGYDLDLDGYADLTMKTADGITTMKPTPDTKLSGPKKFYLSQSTIDGFAGGTEYYSSVTFVFPGASTTDLGSITIDMSSGQWSTYDPVVYQALERSLDAADAGGLITVNKGDPASLYLNGDSNRDVLYEYDGGSLYFRPHSDCSVAGKYTVALNKTAVMSATGDYYSTLIFKLPNPFVDVSEYDDCYDAIMWAYSAYPQVTTGWDETHFGPDMPLLRGQAVTFLWRAMGKPTPSSMETGFTDLVDDYYKEPIAWAVEMGITNGVGGGRFVPGNDKSEWSQWEHGGILSTAHMVTFLYRTMNPGKNGWYTEAAQWADSQGYLAGTGLTAGSISEDVQCPRKIAVMLLYNVLTD